VQLVKEVNMARRVEGVDKEALVLGIRLAHARHGPELERNLKRRNRLVANNAWNPTFP
jgi:hypothetical protein